MCPSNVSNSTQPCPILSSSSIYSATNGSYSNERRAASSINTISSTISSYEKQSRSTSINLTHSNDYYTKKRIEDLQERMDDLQLSSFSQFLKYHLPEKYQPIEGKDLAKVLANGHVWIDLIEILSSSKLKREQGRTRFHALANIQYVLNYLKPRVQHINISPQEILAGNRKEILALLWMIMKTFDFAGFRLTTNRHIFSEQTLFGFGQDHSRILQWLNHLLNQSLKTIRKIYVENFYLNTWIPTSYLCEVVKYVLPLSKNYLTRRSLDCLRAIEEKDRSNQERFQLALDLATNCFYTITIIDYQDKTEKSLFRFFTEFQTNVFNCLKTHQIGKLNENNPYIKHLLASVLQPPEHTSIINDQKQYLICLKDDPSVEPSASLASAHQARVSIDSIGHSSSSSMSDDVSDELVNDNSNDWQEETDERDEREQKEMLIDLMKTNGQTEVMPLDLSNSLEEIPSVLDDELKDKEEEHIELSCSSLSEEDNDVDVDVDADEDADANVDPDGDGNDQAQCQILSEELQRLEDKIDETKQSEPLSSILQHLVIVPGNIESEEEQDDNDDVASEAAHVDDVEQQQIELLDQNEESNQVCPIIMPSSIVTIENDIDNDGFVKAEDTTPAVINDESQEQTNPTAVDIDWSSLLNQTSATVINNDVDADVKNLDEENQVIDENNENSEAAEVHQPCISDESEQIFVIPSISTDDQVLPDVEIKPDDIVEIEPMIEHVPIVVDEEPEPIPIPVVPDQIVPDEPISPPVIEKPKEKIVESVQSIISVPISAEVKPVIPSYRNQQAYSSIVKKVHASPSSFVTPQPQPSCSSNTTYRQPVQNFTAPVVTKAPVPVVQPVEKPTVTMQTSVGSTSTNKNRRARRNNAKKRRSIEIPAPPASIIIQDDEAEEIIETPPSVPVRQEPTPKPVPTSKVETQSTVPKPTPVKENEFNAPLQNVNNKNSKKKKKKTSNTTVLEKSDAATASVADVISSTAQAASNSTTMATRSFPLLMKEYLRDPRIVPLKYVFVLFCFCFTIIILVAHQ